MDNLTDCNFMEGMNHPISSSILNKKNQHIYQGKVTRQDATPGARGSAFKRKFEEFSC